MEEHGANKHHQTKYLTALVRHKGGPDWEAAFADVAISFAGEAEFWSGMGEWLERRLLAYPPEMWDYWTTFCEQPGAWRGVPNLPPGA